MLEEKARWSRLYALYGPLLSPKQQQVMERFLWQDLTLVEIGAEISVTRQGIHDLLQRTGKAMERWESKLQFQHRLQAVHVCLLPYLEGTRTAFREEDQKILEEMLGV